MSMKQLTQQYEEQLKSVKAQIKTFEKGKKELQDSIKQMKHYL